MGALDDYLAGSASSGLSFLSAGSSGNGLDEDLVQSIVGDRVEPQQQSSSLFGGSSLFDGSDYDFLSGGGGFLGGDDNQEEELRARLGQQAEAPLAAEDFAGVDPDPSVVDNAFKVAAAPFKTLLDGLQSFGSSASGVTTALFGQEQNMADGSVERVEDYGGRLGAAVDRFAGAWGDDTQYGWGQIDELRATNDDSVLADIGKKAGAFAGDMLSDPLSYLTAGTLSASRKGAAKLAEEGIRHGLRSGSLNTVRQFLRESPEAASKLARSANPQRAARALGREGDNLSVSQMIDEAPPGQLSTLAEEGLANEAAATLAGRGRGALRSRLYEVLGDEAGDEAFEHLMGVSGVFRRPRMSVPFADRVGFDLTTDPDNPLVRALNRESPRLADASAKIRRGLRNKRLPTDFGAGVDEPRLSSLMGRRGTMYAEAADQAVEASEGFGRAWGDYSRMLDHDSEFWRAKRNMTQADLDDLTQVRKVLTIQGGEKLGEEAQEAAQDSMSEFVNARGADVEEVAARLLDDGVDPTAVAAGREAAEGMEAMLNRIAREIQTAGGGTAEETREMLQYYVPRFLAEEAERAGSSQAMSRLISRSGKWTEWRENEDGQLVIDRFLSPKEIAELEGEEVFELGALDMMTQYIGATRKLRETDLLLRNLADNDLLGDVAKVTGINFDDVTRAEGINDVLPRMDRVSDLLEAYEGRPGGRLDGLLRRMGFDPEAGPVEAPEVVVNDAGDFVTGTGRRYRVEGSPAREVDGIDFEGAHPVMGEDLVVSRDVELAEHMGRYTGESRPEGPVTFSLGEVLGGREQPIFDDLPGGLAARLGDAEEKHMSARMAASAAPDDLEARAAMEAAQQELIEAGGDAGRHLVGNMMDDGYTVMADEWTEELGQHWRRITRENLDTVSDQSFMGAAGVGDSADELLVFPPGQEGRFVRAPARGTPVKSPARQAKDAPNLPGATQRQADDFDELAMQQRGEPEQVMREAQQELEGGELSYLLEHVGDLTHRMAKSMGPGNYGHLDVERKLRSALQSLSSSASLRQLDNDAARAPGVLQRYADAHAKLPVHNDAQRKARDAAVALGQGQFAIARRNIEELAQLHADEAAWRQAAGAYDAPARQVDEEVLDEAYERAAADLPGDATPAQVDALAERYAADAPSFTIVDEATGETIEADDLDGAYRAVMSAELRKQQLESVAEAREEALDAITADRDALVNSVSGPNLPQEPEEIDAYLGAMTRHVSRWLEEDPERSAKRFVRESPEASQAAEELKELGWRELEGQGRLQSNVEAIFGNFAPNQVATAIERHLRPPDDQFFDGFWRAFNTVFKIQATSGRGPGYIGRNMIGGGQNAWLQGVKGRDWMNGGRAFAAEAAALSRARKEVGELATVSEQRAAFERHLDDIITEKFDEETATHVRYLLEQYNDSMVSGQSRIWEQFIGSGIPPSTYQLRKGADSGVEGLDRAIRREPPTEFMTRSRRAATAVSNLGWTRFWNRKAQQSEKLMRLATFSAGLREEGLNDFGSLVGSMKTKLSQFDYRDLSPVEKALAGKFIPFYTWARNNVPLQFRALAAKPRHQKILREIQQTAQAHVESGDHEARPLPDWMEERYGFDTGIQAPGAPEGATLAMGVESPASDLYRMFGTEGGMTDELLGMLHPIPKSGLERLTDQDMFTGQPFQPAEETPWWARVPGLSTEQIDGSRVSDPANLQPIRNMLPWLGQSDRFVEPIVREATGMEPATEDDRYGERISSTSLSTLFGVPAATLNERQLSGMEYGQEEELREDLEAAGYESSVQHSLSELLDPAEDDVHDAHRIVQDALDGGVPPESLADYLSEAASRVRAPERAEDSVRLLENLGLGDLTQGRTEEEVNSLADQVEELIGGR